MVTKEQFANSMMKLSAAYGRGFVFGVESASETKMTIISTWMKYFKDYSDRCFEGAVDEWIKANSKAPSIADLRRMCGQLKEELGEMKWQ